MKRYYLWIAGFIFSFFLAKGQTSNSFDWPADIRFLKKELPKSHIDLFHKVSKKEFERMFLEIEQHCNSMSDLEVAMAIQKILVKIGDAHTGLNFSKLFVDQGILPLHLYWFSDGIYVLHTLPEFKEMLGCRIVNINGHPVQELVDSLSTLMVFDNPSQIKANIPKYIPGLGLLRAFGFCTGDTINVEVQSPAGISATYKMYAAKLDRKNRVMCLPDSINQIVKSENKLFDQFYYSKDSILYILYNKCWSKELEVQYKGAAADKEVMLSFTEFQYDVMHAVSYYPFKKLVFDMRFNTGGSSEQGTEFIQKLAASPKVNQKGHLFVVIGRHTFSSAILNTMDFKENTSAIFVGEDTGGRPNHYGETKVLKLPSSGLSVTYSTKYFVRTKEDLPTIHPDQVVEITFSDFKSGVDPVYEWIAGYK